MTRFARRLDANHSEIVEAYERLGVAVVDLSRVAELSRPGLPDLLCSLHGQTWLTEVKTDTGELSDAQRHFAELWKGQIHVVRTVDDVIAVVNVIKGIVGRK